MTHRLKPNLSPRLLGVVLILALSVLPVKSFTEAKETAPRFGIAIHGGAGTILRGNLTPELERSYNAKLEESLLAGYEVLKKGGSSLDAVEAAIRVMEDSPLFNAGKGVVFTSEGTNEMDASIMNGKTLEAGAIAGVKRVKNPISLARLVMEKSPHVMMTGEGAEAFAKQHGVEMAGKDYFYTERRWKELQRAKEEEKREEKKKDDKPGEKNGPDASSVDRKHGTVGCVALDKEGNLAAGTSTGGMTNKRFGRVGDAPIIGAGTYANNLTCAVSSTGHGEYFIRSVVAHDISALIEYKGMSLKEAADMVVMDKLVKLGATGGVIALDKDGNVAMPFNTPGMYRAYTDANGKPVVKIYKD
ncbi:MAG: isoaspartyl peptidase/L-asparaginase [Blastocatellia bacterium]|nr:isoaspartyl peptidase/L-asparaginase [Blastocatellia bacterium]